jgi:DNA invertase Pin-like site-specific DNA recombinase
MLKSSDAEVVVVYHADRLYRRLADLERLVEVVEVTGAQHESERIQSRRGGIGRCAPVLE